MAYFTGTAASMNEIQAALVSAMTDNGWSQDGGVLSKGGTFVSLVVGKQDDTDPSVPDFLNINMGNGVDESGMLEDRPLSPRIGCFTDGTMAELWDWPVPYHIHVLDNPSEVYLLVNYKDVRWQHIFFGRSPSAGNAGTGNWLYGTIPRRGRSPTRVLLDITPEGSQLSTYYGVGMSPMPFFWAGGKDNSYPPMYMNAQIHGCLDPSGHPVWSDSQFPWATSASRVGVSAGLTLSPLLSIQPNAWNLEATLLPVQIYQFRSENKVSLIGELGHCRFTRNDYLPDGSVVFIGDEKWKVYSAFQRNTAARNGGRFVSHSGTFALAIRYDGP